MWDKIKGALLKDEEPEVELPKKKFNKAPQTLSATPPTPGYVAQPTVLPTDMGKYEAIFQKVFEERNIPGPDFYEFFQVYKSYQTAPLSEQQKITMAFTALKTMGLTKEKLVESAETYLTALQEESNKFTGSINSFEKENVNDVADKIAQLEQDNKELEQKMLANANEIVQLKTRINESRLKIEQNKASFTSALSNFTTEINHLLENSKQHIV